MRIDNPWTWNFKDPYLKDYKNGLNPNSPFRCLKDIYDKSQKKKSDIPKINRHIFIELNQIISIEQKNSKEFVSLKNDRKHPDQFYKKLFHLDIKTGQLYQVEQLHIKAEYRFKCVLGFILFPLSFVILEGFYNSYRWFSLQDPKTLGYTEGRTLPDGRVKRVKALFIQDLKMIKSMFLYTLLMESFLFIGIFCPLTGRRIIGNLERNWNLDFDRKQDYRLVKNPPKAEQKSKNQRSLIYIFLCFQPIGNIYEYGREIPEHQKPFPLYYFTEGNRVWSRPIKKTAPVLRETLLDVFKSLDEEDQISDLEKEKEASKANSSEDSDAASEIEGNV